MSSASDAIYLQSFEQLVMLSTNNQDIMAVDFGNLDPNLGVDSFDLRKVWGNVRLSEAMILSPKEENQIRRDFLNLKIP